MPFDDASAQYLSENNPFTRNSYFADASPEELEALTRIRTVHYFPEGKRVPVGGPENDGFYYIHDGYVRFVQCRSEGEETIRIAGPRDLIGYARWLSTAGRYNMVTMSNVTASFFKRDEFLRLQSQSAYLANEVVRWLMTILTSQEQRILSLKEKSAKGRVIGTLSILHQRFGRTIGGNNSVVAAPIDRKTLADLSGVAVEVLSRVLSELEEDGVISRRGRVIVIVDTHRLVRACC